MLIPFFFSSSFSWVAYEHPGRSTWSKSTRWPSLLPSRRQRPRARLGCETTTAAPAITRSPRSRRPSLAASDASPRSAARLLPRYENVDIIIIIIGVGGLGGWVILTQLPAICHPARAVRCALLRAHTDRVLIGACNLIDVVPDSRPQALSKPATAVAPATTLSKAAGKTAKAAAAAGKAVVGGELHLCALGGPTSLRHGEHRWHTFGRRRLTAAASLLPRVAPLQLSGTNPMSWLVHAQSCVRRGRASPDGAVGSHHVQDIGGACAHGRWAGRGGRPVQGQRVAVRLSRKQVAPG